MRSSRCSTSSSTDDARMSMTSSLGGDDGDPYAINGVHFNRDMFIKKIVQDYPLDKLMQTEKKLIQEISDLGSDMQTLVYENYNKFISATDTIRKMKTDFKEMEDKMTLLSENIAHITESSTKIAESLTDNRQKVSKYSGIHELLKKLKFLFELPNTLKQHSEDCNYEEAIRCYLNGLQFMEEFKRFPSLEAIKLDCQDIVSKIRSDLYDDFADEEKSSQDLTRNVALLVNLNEDPAVLAQRFLKHSLPKLDANLDSLRTASNPNVPLDEFMELSCGIFLSNLSLVIASYSQAFIQATELSEDSKEDAQNTLQKFVVQLLNAFLDIMEGRLTTEVKGLVDQEPESRVAFLKTLDRLYRRLMAMGTVIANTDFTSLGLTLIAKITQLDADLNLERVKVTYEKSVKESGFEVRSHPGSSPEILGSILASLREKTKSGLDRLRDYTHSDYYFSQNAEFRQRVAISIVREGYVIALFKYLVEFGKSLLTDNNCDHLTWILIAKLYMEIEMNMVEYMVNAVEADYDIKRDRKRSQWTITNVADVTIALSATSKKLVEEFVSFQGNEIGELMREGVTTKNLISVNTDPVGPQPQMRKIVDILTNLEKYIQSIFPEVDHIANLKSERSSDSSKRSYSTLPSGGVTSKTIPQRSSWSTPYDPNMSSNIQKLFSEKVEIFGEVAFQKSEILMSIVKIGLRALLEIVRFKTLGRQGLHQIQVDVRYLQLYLWRFVNNEGFLSFLLDEILSSSIQRCVDPVQLDPTFLEILAEKST